MRRKRLLTVPNGDTTTSLLRRAAVPQGDSAVQSSDITFGDVDKVPVFLCACVTLVSCAATSVCF
jgi:hypothetical protein